MVGSARFTRVLDTGRGNGTARLTGSKPLPVKGVLGRPHRSRLSVRRWLVTFVQLFGTGSPFQSHGSLAEWLGKITSAVVEKLQQWNPNELLNTPVDDVVDFLV